MRNESTHSTCPPTSPSHRERAKALIARLRHMQLLTALSGHVMESATYAERALRIRRAYCTCAVPVTYR